MKRCLVTGGAGFIGSHLAEALLKRGDEVIVLDDFSTGKKENITNLKKVPGKFTFIEASVLNSKAIREATYGVDVIFHQAALGSVPKSLVDPLTYHEVNIHGTLKLLIAAKEAKVQRFVVAASSSAYGETPELPKRESMVPIPLSPYAVTKLAQEQYASAFAASYGMETVSLRYFNVYGPRQDPTSQYAAVIPSFFDHLIRGEPPQIYGDGEQTRDFTFVGDVVEANLKAAEIKDPKGGIFNIAGGKQISINELATIIGKLVRSKLKPKYLPPRAGDIRHSVADISRAKKVLGWTPKTRLEDGLRIAHDWYNTK